MREDLNILCIVAARVLERRMSRSAGATCTSLHMVGERSLSGGVVVDLAAGAAPVGPKWNQRTPTRSYWEWGERAQGQGSHEHFSNSLDAR